MNKQITPGFDQITTEDELDKWIRVNIEVIHGDAEMNKKIYKKRLQIIENFKT